MQMIRYHPLIDGDTDGLEKVPMFLSTDKETVRQNSRMYLSEIISNYYRLYSKEADEPECYGQHRNSLSFVWCSIKADGSES